MLALGIAGNPHWVDDLSPWIWRVHGDFGLRWYGLAFGGGFYTAWLIGMTLIRRGRLYVQRTEWTNAVISAAAGTVIFAHFGDIVLYNFDGFLAQPTSSLWLQNGGMSSFAGIVGLIFGLWLFSRHHHLDGWPLFEVAAVAGPIGVFFGRLANFVNGELWGRPSEMKWAVIFPDAPLVLGVNVPRHPSQLYAAILEGVAVFTVTSVI